MILVERGAFAVRVREDGEALLVHATLPEYTTVVPVPTDELVDLVPHEDDRLVSRRTLATGLAPAGPRRWIALVFARGAPWLLGPLSAGDAATLALAFRAWRAAHPIDRSLVEVTEADLVSDPQRWYGRRIAVTGDWRLGPEGSAFAGGWLQPPADGLYPDGAYRVRVVGTWRYEGTDGRAVLRAQELEILER